MSEIFVEWKREFNIPQSSTFLGHVSRKWLLTPQASLWASEGGSIWGELSLFHGEFTEATFLLVGYLSFSTLTDC